MPSDQQDDRTGDKYYRCEHAELKALILPAKLGEMADDRAHHQARTQHGPRSSTGIGKNVCRYHPAFTERNNYPIYDPNPDQS